MCGRYTETVSMEKLAERFGFKGKIIKMKSRYNIAPSQEAPVLLQDNKDRALKMMRWGLIPAWAKEIAIGNKMINARSETLTQKPSFSRSFKNKRCLVIADSFYEWKKMGSGKGRAPLRISLKSDQPFAFAGLWDVWRAPDGAKIESFTIVTTQANRLLKPIHDRMPVILKPQDEASWLNPDSHDTNRLKNLLIPYNEKEMKYYEVSTLVNKPANDIPECIQPLKGFNLN